MPPGLRQLSVSELTETLEEVETAIRRYSEELIQALALRDELDYEKEVPRARDLERVGSFQSKAKQSGGTERSFCML